MDNPSISSTPIEDGSQPKQTQCDITTNASTKYINLHDSKTILQGLTLSPWQPDMGYLDEIDDDNTLASLDLVFPEMLTISNKMTCSLCGCNFDNREQQTEHYKLDWHRFNLKQRILGTNPVTMETFEDMSGDISSLSGSESSCNSDSDSIEEPTTAQTQSYAAKASKGNTKDGLTAIKQKTFPRVFFRTSEGQLISVHRCILHGKKNVPSTQSQLITMATRLSNKPIWAVIMTGGGHFAAAVFRGCEMVVHKTFHRYTVRAKRGTAQGMRDGQQGGNQPKSAGASIRRYNEAALTQDIQDLLESWKDKLATCQRIFLRAPSYNRSSFFGGKTPPFTKNDVRICSIPFPTRRATLKELNRIHGVLSNVHCYGDAEEAEARLNKIFSGKKNAAKSKPKKSGAVVSKTTESVNEIPVLVKEEESTDEEDESEDISLVYEDVETSTQHLKEFDWDCGKKQPRRRKKKKATAESEKDITNDCEGDKMTNDLYTACKSGNIDKLRALLNEISKSDNKGVTDSITMSNRAFSDKLENICDDSDNKSHNDDPVAAAQNVNDEQTATDALCLENKTKDETLSENSVAAQSNSGDTTTNVIDDERTRNTVLSDKPHCQISVVETESITGATVVTIASVLNNPIDKKGSTLLHIAAQSGHVPVVWLLLESGAEPSLRNKKGQPPYLLSGNKEIRNEFRRFMASHPDRYNYDEAKIPGPLTENMEEERAKKAAEKKKAQRKAKQAKQKEQVKEEKKKAAEQKEKMRFSALSDREKRALLAESRLAKQVQTTNASSSGPRCWSCGDSLAGKVPFAYMDWKFCSMECLRKHKQQQQKQ